MPEICTCTLDDISEIQNVITQSYLENYTEYWTDYGENYVKSSFNADQLSQEISNPNTIFCLIRMDKKCVGIIKINIDHAIDPYDASEALELERIYLIKTASGQGLGKKAIDYVKNFAKQKSKKCIWLKTMEKSSAAAFYIKQGFTIISEKNLVYPNIKEEFKKMFIMLCKL